MVVPEFAARATGSPPLRREAEFEALVTPHLARAHAVARRWLGCDHLAADAVQEALVAWWHEAIVPDDPRGWLLRTVVHRCQHLRRTLQRRARHEHFASQHCELHRGCDNPLHQAAAHELGERLDRATGNLPTEQRTAFALFEHGGCDYAHIATQLGVPEGTVRSRLHRARAALQRALQGTLRDADDD